MTQNIPNLSSYPVAASPRMPIGFETKNGDFKLYGDLDLVRRIYTSEIPIIAKLIPNSPRWKNGAIKLFGDQLNNLRNYERFKSIHQAYEFFREHGIIPVILNDYFIKDLSQMLTTKDVSLKAELNQSLDKKIINLSLRKEHRESSNIRTSHGIVISESENNIPSEYLNMKFTTPSSEPKDIFKTRNVLKAEKKL